MQNNPNSLNEIFEILWRNSLVNSNVLIQNQLQFWTLYTFMPYQKDCSTLAQMEIESFTPLNYTENMTVSEDQLFPEKLNDFNKCPLHIATSIFDPFVTIHNTSNGNIRYGGVDINIVKQVSKSLNFIAIYTNSPDGTGHGIVFPNQTITGNLKLVWIFL